MTRRSVLASRHRLGSTVLWRCSKRYSGGLQPAESALSMCLLLEDVHAFFGRFRTIRSVSSCRGGQVSRARRFYGILNSLGLYNKEAKILFLVRLFCGVKDRQAFDQPAR